MGIIKEGLKPGVPLFNQTKEVIMPTAMSYNRLSSEMDDLIDKTVDKLIELHQQKQTKEKLSEVKDQFNQACRELVMNGASHRDIETYFALKGSAIQRAVKMLAPLGLLQYLAGRGNN